MSGPTDEPDTPSDSDRGQPTRPRGARVRGLFIDLSPLHHDREYRLLYVGQAMSQLGNQMTRLALPFQVYVLTGSPAALGLISFVQLIPTIFMTFLAGPLVDAIDHRKLLLMSNTGRALASVGLLVLALVDAPPLWLIYVMAFFTGTFAALDGPTRLSALTRLVARPRLPAALTLHQLSHQGATIVGPAIAGVLLATLGPAGAYLGDALSFIPVLAAVVMMAPIPPVNGGTRVTMRAIREGMRFAVQRRVILATFVLDLQATLFASPVVLFPVLALEVFKVGPAGVGALAAAPAVGAVLAALTSGWVGNVRRTGLAVIAVVTVWGIAITLFGFSTFSFALALVLLAIAGAADVLSSVFRSTIVQLETPDELRGRVSAMHSMVVRAGPRLGDIEAAAVASVAGAQFAVVSGGILCLVGLAVVARAFPTLRAYRRPEGTVGPPRR